MSATPVSRVATRAGVAAGEPQQAVTVDEDVGQVLARDREPIVGAAPISGMSRKTDMT